MDLAVAVDCMIKLVEHLGPCAALLLVLHAQNSRSLATLLAKLDHLHGQLEKKE
jgi:hypothetical protein